MFAPSPKPYLNLESCLFCGNLGDGVPTGRMESIQIAGYGYINYTNCMQMFAPISRISNSPEGQHLSAPNKVQSHVLVKGRTWILELGYPNYTNYTQVLAPICILKIHLQVLVKLA